MWALKFTFISMPGDLRTRMERMLPTRPRRVTTGMHTPWVEGHRLSWPAKIGIFLFYKIFKNPVNLKTTDEVFSEF